MDPGRVRIIVLDDGETYTGVRGCAIYEVDADMDGDEIEDALRSSNKVYPDPRMRYVCGFDSEGNQIR